MADIGIRVVVSGVAQARQNIGAIQSDISRLERTLVGLHLTSTAVSQSITHLGRQLSALGSSLMGVGRTISIVVTAPLAFMGASAIKAGIDFENAFASVLKTTEGLGDTWRTLTPLGEKVLAGLREMAKEMPLMASELAEVMAVAGQLGIAESQLVEFTRVMAEMGVTTNLTAEEAAYAIARIENIFEVSAGDMASVARHLGSTVVDMGNNFATTEADVMEFATRIAAAGRIVGMTIPDIVAIATATTSVGVQVEAGGTAIQRVLIGMEAALAGSAEKMLLFATTANRALGEAGMTVEEFAELMRTKPIEAFTLFIKGLKESGEDAFAILKGLGLADQRLIRTILSLANAGDLLERTVRRSNQAWEENNALADEARKRFETVRSKLGILRNRFVDLGITLFDLVRDPLVKIIEGLGNFIDHLAKLDPHVLRFGMVLAGLVAAIGPIILVLGTIISLLGTLLTVIAPLFTPLGLLAGAIGLVGTSSLVASDQFGSFVGRLLGVSPEVQGVFEGIQASIEDILPTFENVLSGLSSIPIVGIIFDKIKEAIGVFTPIEIPVEIPPLVPDQIRGFLRSVADAFNALLFGGKEIELPANLKENLLPEDIAAMQPPSFEERFKEFASRLREAIVAEWDYIKDDLVPKFVEIAVAFASAIGEKLLEWLAPDSQTMSQIKQTFENFGIFVQGVLQGGESAAPGIRTFSEALTKMLDDLLSRQTAVELLGVVSAHVEDISETLAKHSGDIEEGGGVLSKFLQDLSPYIEDLGPGLRELSVAFADLMLTIGGFAVKTEATQLMGGVGIILRILGWDPVSGKSWGQIVGETVTAIITNLTKLLQFLAAALQTGSDLQEGWVNFFSTLFNPQKDTEDINAAGADIIQRTITFWDEIRQIFSSGADNVQTTLDEKVPNWVTPFNQVRDEVTGHSIIPDMVAEIIAQFLMLDNKVTSILNAWKEGIISIIGGLKTSILTDVESMRASVEDTLLRAWKIFLQWLKDNVPSIVSEIGKIVDAIASINLEALGSPKMKIHYALEDLEQYLNRAKFTIDFAQPVLPPTVTALQSVVLSPALSAQRAYTDNSIAVNIHGVPIRDQNDLVKDLTTRLTLLRSMGW